LPEEYSKFS